MLAKSFFNEIFAKKEHFQGNPNDEGDLSITDALLTALIPTEQLLFFCTLYHNTNNTVQQCIQIKERNIDK